MLVASPESAAWTAHPWVVEDRSTVRFGIAFGARSDWPAVRDFAQMVEGLGFDSYWYSDHPLLGMDCWTALSGVSHATKRVRLGSFVSCVYYRHPVLLARTASDVDRMSEGRLILGLGIGDFTFEFERMGIPMPSIPERQQALKETLQILNGLLESSEPYTYEGDHFQVRGASLLGTRPPQPRIPIVLGGGGERVTLRQVAQYADASNISESRHAGSARRPEDVERKYAVLQGHCATLSRPYESVLRTHTALYLMLGESQAAADAKLSQLSPFVRHLVDDSVMAMTPDAAVAYYRRLIEAGVQYFIPGIYGNDLETVHLLAEEVIPALQDS
jgi:alkanesulfonate monooxygenase SsuD/methylene tetrahydromethanopterin reductase-like flavin-dependent oxidoreductase (luciferase family)